MLEQLRSWHRLAVAACGKEHGGYNIERLGQEVDKLERRLSSVHSPLVPSHNDVNHLNILLKVPTVCHLLVSASSAHASAQPLACC